MVSRKVATVVDIRPGALTEAAAARGLGVSPLIRDRDEKQAAQHLERERDPAEDATEGREACGCQQGIDRIG